MTTNDMTPSEPNVAELRQRIAELEQTAAELRRQCDQVRHEADLYHGIVQNVPGMVYRFVMHADGSSSFEYAGAGSRELLGIEPEQALGDSTALLERIHPDDRASYISSVEQAIVSRMTWQWVGRQIHISGEVKWVEGTSRPQFQPNGDIIWDGIMQDVTERKQAEDRLRMVETLVENAPDGFSVANTDGKIIYANPAFATMLGYTQPLQPLHFTQLHPAEERAHAQAAMRQVLEIGRWDDQIHYQRADGSAFNAAASIFLVRDPSGDAHMLAALIRDLTEAQRAEQERLALQEEVIQAQQAALRELSTPLIPLTDEVVAMPLIGSINSTRAQQALETLLEGVASSRASTVILDITGVPVVDTQVANALLRTAQAVTLLGAKVVLTGIRPEVAQTIVSLGVDLKHITTRQSLQQAIAHVLAEARAT